MNREKLLEQLTAIRKQAKEIREQLDALDYEERFADAKQYEGRYFKEVNEYHEKSIRCLFVYATDKEGCEPMALLVSYLPNKTEWFEIEYYSHFHPGKWEEDDTKWNEIDKEEYMQHYEQVQKRIYTAIEYNAVQKNLE